MATRPTLPAPKPLSPRAAQFVRDIFREENERQQALIKAFDAGVASVSGPVRKAKSDEPNQVAVYDENGNLVGVVDSEKITPLAAAESPAKPKAEQAPQAGPAAAAMPADGVQPATKAMSLGVRPGTQQLGGPTPRPRSGVPVVPVDEDEQLDNAIAKAVAHGAALKQRLGPNSGVAAAEQNRIAGELDQLATAVLSATLTRRPR